MLGLWVISINLFLKIHLPFSQQGRGEAVSPRLIVFRAALTLQRYVCLNTQADNLKRLEGPAIPRCLHGAPLVCATGFAFDLALDSKQKSVEWAVRNKHSCPPLLPSSCVPTLS